MTGLTAPSREGSAYSAAPSPDERRGGAGRPGLLRVADTGSALYEGTVSHRRLAPRPHRFRYRVYYVLLNLDELDALQGRVGPLGVNSRAVTSFHDRDHLEPSDEPIRTKLGHWLADRGVEMPRGPVLLLTNLRVLGYVFNPVSYYYCCEPDGTVAFIVAEVNNTFGETYCYLLDDLSPRGSRASVSRRSKVFHVSPFIEIQDVEYDWVFTAPAERLHVHIDEFKGEDKFFDATLSLTRRPLTSRSLTSALLRYPHVTLRTIALIHWQALRLWLKGAPFHRKPALPNGGLRRDGRGS